MLIIQMRNVIDEMYIISRHVKLNRVLDYEKKNYYLANSKNAHLTIKSKKQIFRNSFKLLLIDFANFLLLIFELILKLVNINQKLIVELSQVNHIFTTTKFVIIEIVTSRDIIIYDNEYTRRQLKQIIDQFLTL